ncbi:hypothetical protein [Streptomyces sp. SID3343]|uniref:hypothetical protein n=1 Tax=Streptomyces sp. SID3343 TaxID=2690260 RepID=UPI0013717361|nr:hypothetical protein [Streptomyces sp. SID3343]MYW04550.1 hypothetical protein [Streptomyces sp. SID3343]
MTVLQDIDVPASVQNPTVTVLAQYGAVKGQAFEAAVRYGDQPPGTPLSIDKIRELLGVGAHIAARVLRELTAAGLTVVERIKDTITGRMLGRRTVWAGPGGTGEATTPEQPSDDTARAMTLLRSLGRADRRLAFRDTKLVTLVPYIVDRFEAGESEHDLFRELTTRLPAKGQRITSGFLYHRLTKPPNPPKPSKPPTIPAQRLARPRLIECADCGRPSPTLIPGALCRPCRTGE